MTEPLILISNDDGIDAIGIRTLTESLFGLGKLIVVAPAFEQSAVGHAITIRNPVRAAAYPMELPQGRVEAYAINGTPADCVKLATDKLLPRKPDLVVSGINQGPNTAVNVLYSGTVSAATEGSILGSDAIAFSLCAWNGGDFDMAGRIARLIVKRVLAEGLPPGILLNVNIPDLSYDELKGIAITRQARARWEEEFDERHDPFERPYYWLKGKFVNLDDGHDTDLEAIDEGYVSVSPLHHDMTAHKEIKPIRKWDWSL